MIEAFLKAVAQLGDRAVQRTVLLSVALSVAVFVALWLIVGYLLANTAVFSIGWLDTVIDLLGGLATLVLTWFLFPGVVSAVIGLFLEAVARAVEARHYPSLPKADGLSLGENVVTALRFLVVMVVLNVFMLLFLVVPPVFPFVFYAVNGYLLGREYFELVALRRVDAARARELRKKRQGALFLAGVAIAFLLTVPVVNLLVPVVATAATVHLFERWRHAD